MEITEISVEIGETRNHPFEYGNKRCSVRMTAVLSDEEDRTDAVYALRDCARSHTLEELDTWEEDICREKQIADAKSSIYTLISQIARTQDLVWVQDYKQRALERAMELPEEIRPDWMIKIEGAWQEAIQDIRQREKEREREANEVLEEHDPCKEDDLGW